ncbi:MAG TPA: hypothetical protein PLG48_03285 [Candidatus Avimonas sp.]|nr:hypothetical protein [Clostridiales bacterium]HPU58521.1 hypothetical protein [Candidatus Avimonas sp.]
MKKTSLILSLYCIITAAYISVSLLVTDNKSSVFWFGFAAMLFSLSLFLVVTLISTNKSLAFPTELSIIVFSSLYTIATFGINIIFGYVLNIGLNLFISLHIVVLAIYLVILILLFKSKNYIAHQNSAANKKVYEFQAVISEFEKARNIAANLPEGLNKQALRLIDNLIEVLKFSNFSSAADLGDFHYKLTQMAGALSYEIENILSSKSEDLSRLETILKDTKNIINERNIQIRLMNENI